jgi:hypothetical protein
MNIVKNWRLGLMGPQNKIHFFSKRGLNEFEPPIFIPKKGDRYERNNSRFK